MPHTESKQAHEPDTRAPKPTRVKRALWFGLVGLIAMGLLWVAGYRWLQGELGRVESEVHAGQIGPARSRLARLRTLGLGGFEAHYWRAVCDEAEGHFDSALAAWAAIPPDSSRYANASLRRARLALERGRFAEVEEVLSPLRFPRSSAAFAMRESTFQQLDLFTGRFDDLRRRIEAEYGPRREPGRDLAQALPGGQCALLPARCAAIATGGGRSTGAG